MNIFKGDAEFSRFTSELGAQSVLIVSDINTRKYTESIEGMLKLCGKAVCHYCFESEHLVPEINGLSELTETACGFDYLLGVGSGTINDICKYVSYKIDKKYGIFATAPSMDGYVSSVSALYDNGKKVTLPTTIPADVLIDLNVLKNAPIDMIAAGAGDMIGKYTSLLDWRLAHALQGERYDENIAERMKSAVGLCMSRARELTSRSEEAVSVLIDGLILSGIEMQNAGNSRPASGCEHHISHYLEMAGERIHKQFAPHGVQVALGSLAGTLLYGYALSAELDGISAVCDDISALPSVDELISLYKDIGLPTSFAQIGVDGALLSETLENAYTVRERFTVMSFLHSCGELQNAAGKITSILN